MNFITVVDSEGASQIEKKAKLSGLSVTEIGWKREKLLRTVLADSSWERWSGLVSGPTVEKFLTEKEIKLRAERFNGPRITFGYADPLRQQEALRWMEIDASLLERKMASLSNGELRRVLLARAWMESPTILVIDDLWGGLDFHFREKMEQMLEALNKEGCWIYLINGHRPPCPSRHPNSTPLSTNYSPLARSELLNGAASVPQENELLVQIDDLSISYGEKSVISHLSWSLKAGDRTLLAGPNGSGKSSLLAIIRGDHPQIFKNNLIFFGERPGEGLNVWDLRRRVALLSPELQVHLSPRLSVEEVVLGGIQHLWDRTRQPLWSERLRLQEVTELLEIVEWKNRSWFELTPSMQRRVLLARAFSSQPDILLLDETFHGLSEEDHDAMLRALQREVHLIPALVWVTHEKKSAPNWLNNAIDL